MTTPGKAEVLEVRRRAVETALAFLDTGRTAKAREILVELLVLTETEIAIEKFAIDADMEPDPIDVMLMDAAALDLFENRTLKEETQAQKACLASLGSRVLDERELRALAEASDKVDATLNRIEALGLDRPAGA